MSSTDDPVVKAGLLLRQGDAVAARENYARLSEDFPQRADVWAGLAMASAQLGDFASACTAVDKALAVSQPQPALWLLAASLYQDVGRFQDALEYVQRVPRDHPGYAKARNQMAILLADLQRLDEAEAACREAVAADPEMVRAIANLAAICLKQGAAANAMNWAREAMRRQPDYAMGYVIFSLAAMHSGDHASAVNALDTVLSREPENVDCLLLRATIDRQSNAIEQAILRVRRALAVVPNRIDAICQLADLLTLSGDYLAAREQWGRALEMRPDHLEAALRRVQTLPMVYESASAIDAVRQRYSQELQELSENAVLFERVPAEAIRQITASNFFLAYQGRNDLELQRRYAGFIASILMRVRADMFETKPLNRVDGRRIRIGFASRFFYDSTAGRYFQSWVTGLDRKEFEIFIYYTNTREDGLTESIRAASNHHASYRPTVGEWAAKIAEDELDLLVYPEVGMDAVCATLAAFRLAPIQIAGWGHPVTTGQRTMDYFLSCVEMEPANASAHYSEKLVTLPGLGTRYALPVLDSSYSRKDRNYYGLPPGATLYLVPQSLFKIHPDNDSLFASVLAADANARLVLFAGPVSNVRRLFEARLNAALIASGVSHHERVVFLADVPHPDYLRINQLCDVMLDTLHWSGGNTSLDALSVGLPIVTLPGEYMRGRQSMAMLRRLGLSELIADNADEYVARAVALGKDEAYRARISQQIIDNHHCLFDDGEPVLALQDFFRRAVASASTASPVRSLQ